MITVEVMICGATIKGGWSTWGLEDILDDSEANYRL